MSKVDNYGKSLDIKREQLQALEESVDVATKLFQGARAEYRDVDDNLPEARMVIIETKKQQLTAVVDSYQALGGGMERLQARPDQNFPLANDFHRPIHNMRVGCLARWSVDSPPGLRTFEF